MSLNHIEELTAALDKAKTSGLTASEFQIVVLQGLISLKESHVSLRSRLFNIEDTSTQQPQNKDGTPTEQKLPLMEEDVPEDHLIVQNSQHRMSCHSTTGDFSITKDRLRRAKETFDFNAVCVFDKLFKQQLVDDEITLSFNKSVALLNKLGFKYYGDGKYPLSHYLREIVGNHKTVTFPNFIQAISFSMNSPIPLGLKEGFESMDEDKDGELDAHEVYNMMKLISQTKYSYEDCVEFLRTTDKDNNGILSYVEMLKYFYFTD